MTTNDSTSEQKRSDAATISADVSITLAKAAMYIGDRAIEAKEVHNDRELYQSYSDAMDALMKAHEAITSALLQEYPELDKETSFVAFDPTKYTLQ